MGSINTSGKLKENDRLKSQVDGSTERNVIAALMESGVMGPTRRLLPQILPLDKAVK
jgi:hypothetical protein